MKVFLFLFLVLFESGIEGCFFYVLKGKEKLGKRSCKDFEGE
jgi:hypothetical protein